MAKKIHVDRNKKPTWESDGFFESRIRLRVTSRLPVNRDREITGYWHPNGDIVIAVVIP